VKGAIPCTLACSGIVAPFSETGEGPTNFWEAYSRHTYEK
jgi:hypothetical protein